MGAIWRGQFDGNSFLGLYVCASEKNVLVPRGCSEKFEFGMKALGVPIRRMSVDCSPYLGLYIAMNSNGAVVPGLIEDGELKLLKSFVPNVLVFGNGTFSAVGNNIACNDFGALVNPDIPRKDAAKISDTLGVPVEQHPLAGYKCAGMACVSTNRGWLAHNRISEQEAELLESLFKCKGQNGTVNSGTALVGAGARATSRGAVVGEASSGFEVARVTQAFDIND